MTNYMETRTQAGTLFGSLKTVLATQWEPDFGCGFHTRLHNRFKKIPVITTPIFAYAWLNLGG